MKGKEVYATIKEDDIENFYDLIKRLTLTKEDFSILKEYCDKKDIIFLSTPFHNTQQFSLGKILKPSYGWLS